MSIFGRKSKEEREWQRKAKLRETKGRLSRYVDTCEAVLSAYERNAVEAVRLGNRPLARRFAAKMIALEKQINRAKNLQLILSDMELSREQVGLFNNLAVTMRDFSKVLAQEEVTAKMAGELDRNLAVAMQKSEQIDVALGEVVDSMTDKVWTVGDIDDKQIERELEHLEESAAGKEKEAYNVRIPGENQKEDELDRRIEEGLRKIKEGGKGS